MEDLELCWAWKRQEWGVQPVEGGMNQGSCLEAQTGQEGGDGLCTENVKPSGPSLNDSRAAAREYLGAK